MRNRTRILIYLASVLFILAGLPNVGMPQQEPKQLAEKSSSNMATQWMHFITELAKKEGVLPPPCLSLYAYTGLTLYEAVLPGLKNYQSLYALRTGSKINSDPKENYYFPACANAAMAAVLRKLNILKSIQAIDSMEIVSQNSFQDISASRIDASILFGKKVADSIFSWSKTDGTLDTLTNYIPATGPGHWELPPGTAAVHSGIRQGILRTFEPDIARLTDPGPPPAYSINPASGFYKSAEEIYSIRKNISVADSFAVVAWQNKPKLNYNTMSHMQALLTMFLEKENVSFYESAIIYAKNGMAMFDAIAASFYAKHKYKLINPVHYINNVMLQPNWHPVYPYDIYPSYPSNVVACVSASVAILKKVFGENYHFTDGINYFGALPPSYSSFDEFVTATARYQMLSGLEYRFSVETGILQGNEIGKMINNLPMNKSRK